MKQTTIILTLFVFIIVFSIGVYGAKFNASNFNQEIEGGKQNE